MRAIFGRSNTGFKFDGLETVILTRLTRGVLLTWLMVKRAGHYVYVVACDLLSFKLP